MACMSSASHVPVTNNNTKLATLWVCTPFLPHRNSQCRRSVVCLAASTPDDVPLPSTRRNRSRPHNNGDIIPPPTTLKEEARQSNEEVYDRLIQAFLERSPEEWRKLIAYSKQWPTLSTGVLNRMDERSSELEKGGEAQREMLKAARRLKSISDELAEYAALVEKLRNAPSRDWEGMIARHRNTLGGSFFSYIELRVKAAASAAAAAGQQDSREASALAALGAQVAALVEAHDRVVADAGALDAAAARFADLLASDSMDVAEGKLDQLAASGKIDPALLLTMAKAYAGVKETDATQEEVKDIMAHLYFKAKESFAEQAPPEARILKFLLAVDSPSDRESLVDQAFQPGPPLSTSDADYVSTTPEALLNTVENVLGVYDGAIGAKAGMATSGMAGQAAGVMNPQVIARLRELQTLIRRKYI